MLYHFNACSISTTHWIWDLIYFFLLAMLFWLVNLWYICFAQWIWIMFALLQRVRQSRGSGSPEALLSPRLAWSRLRSQHPADIAFFHQQFVLSGHKQHWVSIVHASREFIVSLIIMVQLHVWSQCCFPLCFKSDLILSVYTSDTEHCFISVEPLCRN